MRNVDQSPFGVAPLSPSFRGVSVKVRILALLLIVAAATRGELVFAEPSASTPMAVGIVLPLTGRAADAGTAVKNGVLLAQEQDPEVGSAFRLIIEDTAYDGKATVTAFQKLVDQDHVSAVIVFGHGPAAILAPLAESKRVPLFAISGEAAVSRKRRYVVRFCTSHDRFAEVLIGALRQRKMKRLGIAKSDLAYMNATLEAMHPLMRSDEQLEIVESFGAEATDFRSTIVKLKGRQFDAVGLFMSEEQIPTLLRQARELDYHPAVFGIHSFGAKEAIMALQSGAPGAFYPAIAVSDEFRMSYQARWKNDLQLSFASTAFDLANFLGELTKRGKGALSADQFMELVRTAPELDGGSGKFRPAFDAENGIRVEFPVVVRRIDRSGVVVE